jgi:ATP dependent DNA ligase-like protein
VRSRTSAERFAPIRAYHRAMLASDAVSAAATWRLQLFGDKRAATIADPIVEPLWTGPRVLALVDGTAVRLTGADGDPIDGPEAIVAALRDAVGGATVLIEAYLTPEPLRGVSGAASRDIVTLPRPGEAMTQMIVGSRGQRKDRLLAQQDEARQRTIEGTDEDLALVAVDLLWLDDESLCDVPLLERKRILESVVGESHLVRVGIHVRPPIDTWLGSWRAFGLRRLAFKAANSRYLPGQKNQEWSQAEIPQR